MADEMMQPDSNNLIPQVRRIVQTLITLRREQGVIGLAGARW
jgi:hypothetical protein